MHKLFSSTRTVIIPNLVTYNKKQMYINTSYFVSKLLTWNKVSNYLPVSFPAFGLCYNVVLSDVFKCSHTAVEIREEWSNLEENEYIRNVS